MSLNGKENDTFLWDQFQNGNEEAFISLFREYYSDLFNYGSKITTNHSLIEDCIQDLFIDIWRQNSKTEIQSVRAYFFKALKFKIIRALSKSDKRISLKTGLPEEFEISYENILISKQENEEMKRRVLKSILELAPRQREIIYLKFYHNLSYEEISEIMKINYQAARNLIYQSIKTLKENILPSLIFWGSLLLIG